MIRGRMRQLPYLTKKEWHILLYCALNVNDSQHLTSTPSHATLKQRVKNIFFFTKVL